MILIKAEKISRLFGGLAAVVNVNFHIKKGEILGLIGPNGAGKTTLFNLISGLFPPTSGIIWLKGENITKMKAHDICKRGIARTFQAGNLFREMTVFENVLAGVLFGKHQKISDSDTIKQAKELLKLVGLSGKEEFMPKDLTIAAQKRIEIARALATNPDLLLLDEVMAGLTPIEVDESLELIGEIRNRGITVFLIEHVMKAIMGISERVIVLHHGEKIAEGTPTEIATSKTVIQVYLGS